MCLILEESGEGNSGVGSCHLYDKIIFGVDGSSLRRLEHPFVYLVHNEIDTTTATISPLTLLTAKSDQRLQPVAKIKRHSIPSMPLILPPIRFR